MRSAYLVWAPLWALILPAVACAQQPEHRLNLGAYFAEGKFNGHSDTTIRYLPIGYQWQGERWGFQLLTAGLSVTGVGNVLVNIGEVTRAIAGSEVTTEAGFGDTIAGISYALDPFADWAPFVDLRLDVKLPTADENRSLGTGELDFSLQIDFSQVYGETTWFASLGRNFRGRTDLFPGLNDNSFAQLGFARQLSERTSAGAFYDYREAPAVFARETHEIYPYVSFQLSPRWSLTALVGRGFTEGSADYALQGQLSYSW
ncbi:MAG: hypothetical protein OXI13_10190 [Gammaproteobacteria bacterium]|nr:hypothetical protein [Gammaproteobacteria bacterium]